MNARERILAAINHQPVDRVPTDIWATPEVWGKLAEQFGCEQRARRAMHIDGITDLRPDYIGPPLSGFPADAGNDYKAVYGVWGAGLKWMANETGRYLEQSHYPLLEVRTIDALEQIRWPDPDWFDYEGLREKAAHLHLDHVIMSGYMAPLFVHQLLRGMELSLIDPLAEPDLTHEILRRVSDFTHEYHLRLFQSCGGLIDLAQVTDDLGSQTGPMFSLDLYREFYAPHHKRFIDLCKAFGIKVFHHDDGAMSAFLPDLVEMGIDVLNPVQWICPGMESESLKANYGARICFHGAVENQEILPFGTPGEVRADVRHCIDALAADGTGYILAPCHNLQSNTPIENIIAMYDEAWHYGQICG